MGKTDALSAEDRKDLGIIDSYVPMQRGGVGVEKKLTTEVGT